MFFLNFIGDLCPICIWSPSEKSHSLPADNLKRIQYDRFEATWPYDGVEQQAATTARTAPNRGSLPDACLLPIPFRPTEKIQRNFLLPYRIFHSLELPASFFQ